MKSLEEFLKCSGALYDETRVKLLKFIKLHGPLCVCDLQNSFGMVQSRLSRHLKILKDAGFLQSQRVGKWIYYEIKDPLDRFCQQALDEIASLPLDLPPLKRESKECKI